MPIKPYPTHEFLPHAFTAEEIADPHSVIAAFFDFTHLPAHRRDLRTLLNVLVTGSFNNQPQTERVNLVDYHCWLEKLVEAAHIIHAKKRELAEKK